MQGRKFPLARWLRFLLQRACSRTTALCLRFRGLCLAWCVVVVAEPFADCVPALGRLSSRLASRRCASFLGTLVASLMPGLAWAVCMASACGLRFSLCAQAGSERGFACGSCGVVVTTPAVVSVEGELRGGTSAGCSVLWLMRLCACMLSPLSPWRSSHQTSLWVDLGVWVMLVVGA